MSTKNSSDWPKEIIDYRIAVTSDNVNRFSTTAINLRRWMESHDPHRPRYHFTAPEGWLNDPNGPIYYKGLYHLFYQYRPVFANGTESEICWGHASSPDLLHWKDLPIAMWPDRRYDAFGVYSGNIFIDQEDIPTAMYTGNVEGRRETHGVMAKSFDDLLTWTKRKVMSNDDRPNQNSPVHWDSQIWRQNNEWLQLVGGSVGRLAQQRGAAHLWRSSDLLSWSYCGILCQDSNPDIKFWELPYLLKFGDHAVLMVGAKNTPYWTGDYNETNLTFTPDNIEPKYVDQGFFYAPNPCMTDNQGLNGSERRIMHGWITGSRSPIPEIPYWIGAHSLPRVISLENDTLIQEPIIEIEQLRGPQKVWRDIEILPGKVHVLDDISSDSFEIQIDIDLKHTQTEKLGITVRMDSQLNGPSVWVSPTKGKFGISRLLNKEQLYATNKAKLKRDIQGDYRKLIEPEFTTSYGKDNLKSSSHTLRVFVDRSILEVYCAGLTLTDRMYPENSALGMALFTTTHTVHINSLKIWELKSALL